MSIYNATKAAVAVSKKSLTFTEIRARLADTAKNCTKTMAMDYAPVIRFNAIAPAVGNTSM